MSRLPTINDDRRGEDLEESRRPGGWGDVTQLEKDRATADQYEHTLTRRWDS